MNNRFSTRRSGSERDRYEAERGSPRSDRERYEFADRDDQSYGEVRDEERGWDDDDRDLREGERGREPMQGRGGHGLSSSSRSDVGYWDRNAELSREQNRFGQHGFRPSGDYRGQGYGGVHGEGRESAFGHRGYGGSMGGSGGYAPQGQRGMNLGSEREGWRGGGDSPYGQGPYGQYGQGPYSQGHYGQSGVGQQLGVGQSGMSGQSGFGFGPVSHQNIGPRRFGKGPKGYKRSDERIREDVCDQLTQTDDVDASELEISVANGEVTITGTVPDRRMKYAAEQIVERVSGVNEIHNQVRVKRQDQLDQNASQSLPGSVPVSRETQHSQFQQSSVSAGAENGRRGGMRS